MQVITRQSACWVGPYASCDITHIPGRLCCSTYDTTHTYIHVCVCVYIHVLVCYPSIRVMITSRQTIQRHAIYRRYGQTATQKAKTDHMVSIGTMLSHRRFIMKYKNIFLSFEVVRSLHQRNGTVTSKYMYYTDRIMTSYLSPETVSS